ncbi:MAG: YceD family protein [Legionella sp.]|jgi:uncharacterized protein
MLYLQDLAKQELQKQTLTINERLPNYIVPPCTVTAQYKVEEREDFYLIRLQVQGIITIICQRCLNEFSYPYDNSTEIAVCLDDDKAEAVLEMYESIIAPDKKVDLETLIVDELYLYAPQFHPDLEDCDSEVKQFLAK